jgi:hypothetical protein
VGIDGSNPKEMPESDLLRNEKYKIISAYQDPANIGILRNRHASCLQKRNHLEKAMSQEKECNKKSAEMQETAMYEYFNSINVAINYSKFKFLLLLKEVILKWKKPFQCLVNGFECTVGCDDAPILQMKPVMVKELTEKVLVKRAKDNDGDIS